MAQRIEIVRGTTNDFEVSIVDANGGAYTLAANERVVFGIKRNPEIEETPLFTKTAGILGAGLFSIKLCPEDTASLVCGKYYYDVSVDDGTEFHNVIEPNLFILTANVTHRGCGG